MKLHIGFLSVVILSLLTCTSKNKSENPTQVTFDASFAGARLDSIVDVGHGIYDAYFYPAFEPVNKSPWYAFGVSAQSETDIVVRLNYGKYKHRYVPKISTDKKTWRKIDEGDIQIDTISGVATLQLKVTPLKKFVSAQEIESSEDTYLWIDQMIEKHPELSKIVVGRSVLGKDNYCLIHENEEIQDVIVLIARQHPPEVPGGTIGFKAFFEELMSDTPIAHEYRAKFNSYSFPLLNPDGVDMGNWRHNANGADLNRDWIDFSQPETKAVKIFIEEKVKNARKIRFAIDFHTSYSGPYLLILDSINESKTHRIIPEWIRSIHQNSEYKVSPRRRSQDLPYCYNYFHNEYAAEAVTYEDGDESDRKIIRQKAKVYAREFMKVMNEKKDRGVFR